MTGNLEYDLYIIGVIAALTVCSIITRSGYYVFGDYLPLSDSVRRALRYAPTAALVGIIVPDLIPLGDPDGGASLLKLAAALVAVGLYWRTKSTLLVIVGGMVAYWILRALFVS
ncbi:AzlD domain-containing protein [Parapusillimonas granuli]|uniref:AzlD domain-containing protein n=1 Tax=Parapusillimonas granuli TaxID=380911 RepID=A0A853G4B2_9BURK|nr:AzlD domain-containing protein [Parapusillimonas granuli]MBB5215067.1 branched-subunit amino acid transport protein [Parapusillimonas granuli]MEB2401374.1 AzlD domain-containing protein [Alcaligenaceae bacterium]NYT49386.1 AzlD domain-containing protein [Parapusillimonas granuli]